MKLLFLIITFIATLIALPLLWVGQAMGWTNMDVTTASWTTASMLPGYKNPLSRQWAAKVVENGGYLYNHIFNNHPYDTVYINETFTAGQVRAYDVAHDWETAPIVVVTNPGAAYWDDTYYRSRGVHIVRLSETFQYFYDNATDMDWKIRHNGTTGFEIESDVGAGSKTLTCMIFRSRTLIFGTTV